MTLPIIILVLVLISSIIGNMITINKNRLTRNENAYLKKEIVEMAKTVRHTQTFPTKAGGETDYVEPEKATGSEKHSLLKRKVLTLVEKYRKEVNPEDLPKIVPELTSFFEQQKTEPYYQVLDLRNVKEDRRIVVIGDTHCDYRSLAAIMTKLSFSSYDYFENAYFVFLGDYLDRGLILFEYLLLLTGIKKLLGERCILLKGNHELIRYNPASRQLESMVYPADSCPTLNDYCGKDKVFLEKFGAYFSQLPYYVLLKTTRGTDLFVHGGIPRDNYMKAFTISHASGEMLLSGDESLRSKILDNMIWSDPSEDKFRMQGGSSRFEFGREQFETFVRNNKIDRLFRSHEPVMNGVCAFYDNRLYTIFSNGGEGNTDTGYEEVTNPVFGIIAIDGSIRFESIHFKKVTCRTGVSDYNTLLYLEGSANDVAMKLDDLHLNNEFFIINQ